jgi:hypothetical protein
MAGEGVLLEKVRSIRAMRIRKILERFFMTIANGSGYRITHFNELFEIKIKYFGDPLYSLSPKIM